MEFIQMNNGVSIPQIGLGVFQTKDGEETCNAVKWALEAGYRHIDTAMIYGNEESVGRGMKESGLAREEIFLTTKLWNADIRAKRGKEAFEESLKRLGTDYVDLYLLHWPVEHFAEAWAALEDLQMEGKIRTIGVSNFQIHHLEELEKTQRIAPAVNQIESHPYFNNQTVIDYCLKKNIQVEAWSPLGGTGGNVLQDPKLAEIGAKYGKSAAQTVIRWDLQRGIIVLPKSTHQDRIVQNLDVFDFELSDEDMQAIADLNRNRRVGPDPDHVDF